MAFTYEGQRFLSDARRLLADWDGAIAIAQDGPLKGPIKITAPLEFGREELAPIVDRFLVQHPEVTITLHMADHIVELVEQQIDLALRFGPLTDSALKALLLLRATRVVCAAPSYWISRGVPERPEDLANHNCLVQARPDAPFATWTFLMDGQAMSMRVRGDRVSNESQALKDWAIAGRGILRRGAWGIRDELRTGTLVTALDSYSAGASNLYAVTSGGMLNHRVRTFIDFLSGQLLASDFATL